MQRVDFHLKEDFSFEFPIQNSISQHEDVLLIFLLLSAVIFLLLIS